MGILFKFCFPAAVSLVGPDSAWLWSAISGIALVLTLFAIYRQLRLQRSVNAREKVMDLLREYNGELVTRQRLATVESLLRGETFNRFSPAIWQVCSYWENIGNLIKKGHLERNILYPLLGASSVMWWQILGPVCADMRLEHSMPDLFEPFEWLVRDVEKRNANSGVVADAFVAVTPEFLSQLRESILADIAILEALRK